MARVAGLLGTLALVGGLHGAQEARLSAAARATLLDAARLASTERSVERVRAVEADVTRLHRLVGRLDTVQRSGPLHAAAVAAIGNRLPGDAWLAALRAEHGGFALEGRAARVGTVGAALAALAGLPQSGGARLLYVHAAQRGAGVSYAIGLEPAR